MSRASHDEAYHVGVVFITLPKVFLMILEKGHWISVFIIYLQRNTPDTTPFPTQKYKILYHLTRMIFFCITILQVLPTSQA